MSTEEADEVRRLLRSGLYTLLETCRTCGGSGEVHSHNPKCWGCSGLGYVLSQDKTTEHPLRSNHALV